MTGPRQPAFFTVVARAYSHGYATFGDLELPLATFQNALRRVIDKHVGPNAFPPDRLSFLRTLHTDDLYLALACAQPTESAWRCFAAAYQNGKNANRGGGEKGLRTHEPFRLQERAQPHPRTGA